MDYDTVLRKHRKRQLADPASLPEELSYDRDWIKKIIPHREPFLLIDALTALDPENGIICGSRYLDPDDSLFEGHFPGYPLYPGSLQIEMIGQLGLCLYYFLTERRTSIAPDAQPVAVRATRVIGAYYTAPLLPGKEITIIAKQLDYDGFFGSVIGQTVSDDGVCCASASEVVFP
jgi:3-hydroxymyristoyl/3-hydroxydecanoyl-(acyl carrier protein) dehydratase